MEELLEKVTGGLDSISAKLILQETYETMYKIFDHEKFSAARPLALVAMQPKENTAEYSKLYRTVYRYQNHQIKDLFGLNLVEFLQLPRELVELMFEISSNAAKREGPQVDKALRQLEQGKQGRP